MRMRNVVIAAVASAGLTMSLGMVGAVATAHADTGSKPAHTTPAQQKTKTGKIVGQVDHLAPGKIIVTPLNGTGQALWLATDTRIKDRMGDLCFKNKPLPYSCTPDQFEETLKKLSYDPWVTITYKDGVALTITSVVPV
ncbi:hypothetical protein [Streptomyces sp. NPDC051567]|uniref:hypothetical protein n=1 Tax=Streptomyces sp. NPDC051567 TaxID=3365660 RepID=UPI0037BE2029